MTNSILPTLTASSALPVGARLGEFEITGVVGEGGFGIVYSAHDSSLDRIVAVKEYLPSAFSCRTGQGLVEVKSEEHRKTFAAGLSSFINEAKMLAKFSHPGLVEVFRFWEGNGTAYMAMRYYRGVTLRQLLRTTPQIVTEQWLCETLDPILLALRELHLEKCYHRDIAPDNILVLPNGRSVLMDFGAARRIIGGMTQALTVVLKPGYAPIEQYYDDGSMPQGSWTDIYAIGGLLYHVMTGKVPVQAISRMTGDPLKPVSELARGNFSARLCEVVMKCLAVLPASRYQSVDELRAALGWVAMPAASTVAHEPSAPAVALQDYPATIILSTAPAMTKAALAAKAPVLEASPGSSMPASQARLDPFATLTTKVGAFEAAGGIAARPLGSDVDPLATVMTKPQAPVPSQVGTIRTAVSQPQQASGATKTRLPIKSRTMWVGGVTLGIILLSALAVFLYGNSRGREDVRAVGASGLPVTPAPTTEPRAVAGSTMETPSNSAAASEKSESIKASAQAAPESVMASALPPEVPPVEKKDSRPVARAESAGSEVAVATGSVRFELKNGWATVFVDGENKGTVPPVTTLKLASGTHEVELQNPALPTIKRTVEVITGKTVVVRHSFAK